MRHILVTLILLAAPSIALGQLWEPLTTTVFDNAIVKVGGGTGTIVGVIGNEAFVLTAQHISQNTVEYHDGSKATNVRVVDSLPKLDGDIKLLAANPFPFTIKSLPVATRLRKVKTVAVLGHGGGKFRKFLAPLSMVANTKTTFLGDEAFVISGDSGGPIINPWGEIIGVVSGGNHNFHSSSQVEERDKRQLHWPPQGAGVKTMARILGGQTFTQYCPDGQCFLPSEIPVFNDVFESFELDKDRIKVLDNNQQRIVENVLSINADVKRLLERPLPTIPEPLPAPDYTEDFKNLHTKLSTYTSRMSDIEETVLELVNRPVPQPAAEPTPISTVEPVVAGGGDKPLHTDPYSWALWLIGIGLVTLVIVSGTRAQAELQHTRDIRQLKIHINKITESIDTIRKTNNKTRNPIRTPDTIQVPPKTQTKEEGFLS